MFQIPVKVHSLEKRRKSIGLLHAVAGFFLLANVGSAYSVVPHTALKFFVPFYIAALLFMLYGFFRKKWDAAGKYNMGMRLFEATAFFAIGIFFVQNSAAAKSFGPFLWAALAGMLAFTEKTALSEASIKIDENGILVPAGFAYKKLLWNEVADVTLRPDFVTIHTANNKMLQFERLSAGANEQEQKLQDFCLNHLAAKPAAAYFKI